MGKKGGKKLQAFCVNRIRPLVRVPMPNNKLASSQNCGKKNDQNSHQIDSVDTSAKLNEEGYNVEGKLKAIGRRIMVVVDSSSEAKGALQWVLTHTLQTHDTIILLYVTKLDSNQGKGEQTKKLPPKVYELLNSMKKTCQSRKPEVEVEVKMAQGKEKGPTILEEARKEEVSLLVMGQKKQWTTWRLLWLWNGGKTAVSGGGGVVEYCIQKAECMALSVRRKSNQVGGYLITTKRHKDFWLLA